MNSKPLTFLDGSAKEREAAMKEFFGLSSEQSFQDIEVDNDTDNEKTLDTIQN